MAENSKKRLMRRRKRVRYQIRMHGQGRPRLSVFRSGKNIYAQVIDDKSGKTLVSASTLEKTVRESLKTGATCEAATKIGSLIASRAKEQGIGEVVFDRGGYLFHGRVKALASSAREEGLIF